MRISKSECKVLIPILMSQHCLSYSQAVKRIESHNEFMAKLGRKKPQKPDFKTDFARLTERADRIYPSDK